MPYLSVVCPWFSRWILFTRLGILQVARVGLLVQAVDCPAGRDGHQICIGHTCTDREQH